MKKNTLYKPFTNSQIASAITNLLQDRKYSTDIYMSVYKDLRILTERETEHGR